MSLLEIRNLSVDFQTAHGLFRAVDSVDLDVSEGDLVAIVGESGSGKSVSMLALMGLLPWTAKVTADRLVFDGRDLLTLSAKERRQIIGKDMAMIFQEPMTSLNPCFTVGFQITESLNTHLGGSRAEHRRRAVRPARQIHRTAHEAAQLNAGCAFGLSNNPAGRSVGERVQSDRFGNERAGFPAHQLNRKPAHDEAARHPQQHLNAEQQSRP